MHLSLFWGGGFPFCWEIWMIICLKFGEIEAASLHPWHCRFVQKLSFFLIINTWIFPNYVDNIKKSPCKLGLIFHFLLTFIWISLIPSIHAPSYKFTVFVIFYILNILERKFHPYQPGTMSLYPMSKQPRSKHYLPGLLQINPDSSYPQT